MCTECAGRAQASTAGLQHAPSGPVDAVERVTRGLRIEGLPRPFFEGWYFRVTLPETHDNLCLIYHVYDPDVPTSARRSAGAQVCTPGGGYTYWERSQVERFRAALSEKIWLTRYFYEEIQKLGFEVGPYPELSVAIYRYIPKTQDANQFNKAIVNRVHEDGRIFISSTTIDGEVWLRLAILSFRTHLREVQILLEVLKDFVDENA